MPSSGLMSLNTRSMANVNIQDSVYQAIEEYNNKVKKPHCQKFSNDERKGMFYTILRRYIIAVTPSRRGTQRGISVGDFVCTFKENGELATFKIKREFQNYAWEIADYDVLTEIKNIGERHKVFHKTPIMNEIADIVNQIK